MQNKKETKIKRIGCLFTLILMVVLFFYLRNIREHRYWYVKQSLINSDEIELEFDSNRRKVWFSFPHAIIIGGGDQRLDIYFNYKGREYNFGKIGSPVLINYWNNFFYIVTLRYQDLNSYNLDFSFYKFEKKLVIIKSEEFPKSIAIPNINLVRNYPEIRDPDIINSKLKSFRYSLTAKLWLRLEKRIHYYKTIKKGFETYEVDESFLIGYKKKYIEPYWSEKTLKANNPRIIDKKKKK